MAVGMAVWLIGGTFFPVQAEGFLGRMPLSPNMFNQQYVAPRFEPGSGKVYRTGAVEIASEQPLTGMGLNVVGRTTDSLLIGVLAMSGVVGGVLYLASIGVVVWRLHAASRTSSDPYLAGLAGMMAILSIVFLLAAFGFHSFIQDRAGDAYWLLVGLLLGPLAVRTRGEGAAGSGDEA